MRLLARINTLEAALRQIESKGREHPDPYIEGSWFADQATAALNPSASETDCECQEHKFERVAINNAKSPADPPEWAYGPYKCVRCGMYQSSDDANE